MNSYTTPRSGDGFAPAPYGPVSKDPFTIAQDLIARVSRDIDEELHQLMDHIGHLMEQMAGFRPDRTGDDARRRLQNPRLRTTYVNHRIQALTAKSIDLREQLSERLKDLVEPALKLEIVEAELGAAIVRRAELDSVDIAREATGLYPAVAVAADYLHEHFRVTHWHWANAGPERLQRVADILLRRDGAN